MTGTDAKKSIDTSIQKTKEYLIEAKDNVKRLKEGKNVKRKLKWRLKENIVALVIVCLIICATITFPLVYKPKHQPEDPTLKLIEQTRQIIQNNFTNMEGHLFNFEDKIPTTRLQILNLFSYIMQSRANYISNYSLINQEYNTVQSFVIDNTFREYHNSSEKIALFDQLLGFYTVTQTYYLLRGTEYSILVDDLYGLLRGICQSYYSYESSSQWGFFIESNNNNISYLDVQSLALWSIATFVLMTNLKIVSGFDLIKIIQSLLNTILYKFYDSKVEKFYHMHNHSAMVFFGEYYSLNLILFTLGVSRTVKIPDEMFSVDFNSYQLHDKIINDFTTEDLKILIKPYKNSHGSIINQYYFSLLSYLMKLNTVGNQSLEILLDEFLDEKIFIMNEVSRNITAESCLYGLMALSSYGWSKEQLTYEHQMKDSIPAQYSFYLPLVMFCSVIFTFLKRKKQLKKKLTNR